MLSTTPYLYIYKTIEFHFSFISLLYICTLTPSSVQPQIPSVLGGTKKNLGYQKKKITLHPPNWFPTNQIWSLNIYTPCLVDSLHLWNPQKFTLTNTMPVPKIIDPTRQLSSMKALNMKSRKRLAYCFGSTAEIELPSYWIAL